MEAVTRELTEILRPSLRTKADDYALMIFGALKALVHLRFERDEPCEPSSGLVAQTFLQGMPAR